MVYLTSHDTLIILCSIHLVLLTVSVTIHRMNFEPRGKYAVVWSKIQLEMSN